MTSGQAILIFLGIPLLLAAIIYVIAAAPSWTRNSRGNATTDLDDATSADAVFIVSGSAAPNPSIVPAEISTQAAVLTRGGAHANW